MIVAVPVETFPHEHRVAIVPTSIASLKKAGVEVRVQSGAGAQAGYPDSEYEKAGASLLSDRKELFNGADIILQVRTYGANPQDGKSDLDLLQPGQTLIGTADPLWSYEQAAELAKKKVQVFAMELIPRITRAQSMDVLSSMANIAGYKAVLVAADKLPKFFPMLMTAAGTVKPAKVFVIGAGVAGLQAIATAKRLGAVVSAYDLRPVVKEQVQSVGGKFIELELETTEAEGKGGYAKEQSDEFIQKQQEMMSRVVAEHDVVITTAAIPGRKSPILVNKAMVEGMSAGAVIVDLAAERGGNCELTKPDETVISENGVTILGPTNLASTVPFHASQMYAKNITSLLLSLVKDGKLSINRDDEIVSETLICTDGEVVQPRIRSLLGLPELAPPEKPSEESKPNTDDKPIPLAGDEEATKADEPESSEEKTEEEKDK